jgi:hypothetical protein
LVLTETTPNKTGEDFWETVVKKSNKTAFVGSLRVNHSSSEGRFIVGHMQLPIGNSCIVANPSFTVSDYTNSTGTFYEHQFIEYYII